MINVGGEAELGVTEVETPDVKTVDATAVEGPAGPATGGAAVFDEETTSSQASAFRGPACTPILTRSPTLARESAWIFPPSLITIP
jgi:hypothetical protein